MGVVQVVVYLLVGLEGKLLWLSVCMDVGTSLGSYKCIVCGVGVVPCSAVVA